MAFKKLVVLSSLVCLGLTAAFIWKKSQEDLENKYFGEYSEEAYPIGQQEEQYFNSNLEKN
jgi:hypothetical protein